MFSSFSDVVPTSLGPPLYALMSLTDNDSSEFLFSDDVNLTATIVGTSLGLLVVILFVVIALMYRR